MYQDGRSYKSSSILPALFGGEFHEGIEVEVVAHQGARTEPLPVQCAVQRLHIAHMDGNQRKLAQP